jgi:hypothetical protein
MLSGLRLTRRGARRVFAAVVVITLALGLGACSAVFSASIPWRFGPCHLQTPIALSCVPASR